MNNQMEWLKMLENLGGQTFCRKESLNSIVNGKQLQQHNTDLRKDIANMGRPNTFMYIWNSHYIIYASYQAVH